MSNRISPSKYHALHFISSNTHNFNCIGVSYSTFKMHFDLITEKLSTPDKHIHSHLDANKIGIECHIVRESCVFLYELF